MRITLFNNPTRHRQTRGHLRLAQSRGFTLVELLIVVVIIAILAAITVVSYQGMQARARDAQRVQDVKTIAQALEMYYIDNGQYPPGLGSTAINNQWSTTADTSWPNLRNYLVPKYISALPTDPTSTPGANVEVSGFDYAYYRNNLSYCGAAPGQMYILVYRKETSPQQDDLQGACTTNVLYYSGASNYRVVK